MSEKHVMTVKVVGLPYGVDTVDDIKLVNPSDDGDILWGHTDFYTQRIRMFAACPERTLRTFLHELLHGIIGEGQIVELCKEGGTHLEPPIEQLANGLGEALESVGIGWNELKASYWKMKDGL